MLRITKKGIKSKSPGKSSRVRIIIPAPHAEWAIEQKPALQKFWLECWRCDPFGSRFLRLNTSLKRSSFMDAKRILTELKLFNFKPDKSTRDNRVTENWLVVNLHGSRRTKTKTEYHKFLESAYWKQVRKLVLARDKYKCQDCGSTLKLQVHHKTYKNHQREHQHLEDLVTLCRPCHLAKHIANF